MYNYLFKYFAITQETFQIINKWDVLQSIFHLHQSVVGPDCWYLNDEPNWMVSGSYNTIHTTTHAFKNNYYNLQWG